LCAKADLDSFTEPMKQVFVPSASSITPALPWMKT